MNLPLDWGQGETKLLGLVAQIVLFPGAGKAVLNFAGVDGVDFLRPVTIELLTDVAVDVVLLLIVGIEAPILLPTQFITGGGVRIEMGEDAFPLDR